MQDEVRDEPKDPPLKLWKHSSSRICTCMRVCFFFMSPAAHGFCDVRGCWLFVSFRLLTQVSFEIVLEWAQIIRYSLVALVFCKVPLARARVYPNVRALHTESLNVVREHRYLKLLVHGVFRISLSVCADFLSSVGPLTDFLTFL